MTTRVISLPNDAPDALDAGVAAAASALEAGGLVVLPTETVYGLAASSASAPALAALRELTDAPEDGVLAWHAASRERVLNVLTPVHPAHRRLVSRLLPGPVTLAFEAPAGELVALVQRAGVSRGVIDDGTAVWVRVPDDRIARALLARLDAPVVARSRPGLTKVDAAPDDDRILIALDAGPSRFGGRSTLVRLRQDGSFDVEFEGPVDARYVRRQAERRVLFVCTGNTCRSPMAAAIARAVVPHDVHAPTLVGSAGVSAADGMPASDHVAPALARLDIDAPEHRSRMLTRHMLAEADVVFAMTPSHLEMVRSADPSARTMLLDPSGGGVSDPIGGTLDDYVSTAEQLRDLIEQRLEEMER